MVLDTQSVHAAAGVPSGTTGRDAGKKVPGRKRGLAVDVLGLVIAVVALAASAHENTAGIALLDKIDAREAALTCEAEHTRARIDELTARLHELDQAIDHLRITRKTLVSLAEDDTEPATPPPSMPDHSAYQQILTVFADVDRPLRARDLCQALDLPIVSKNTENIRSKLKRLVSRGILVETEPGLFTQPRPSPSSRPPDQPASSNPNDERGINSRTTL
ncbi:transposase [Microtetraspora sp. NBRC 16547]|uniref:transposase n=1 Tax=Microtetraspora sp. NBRC 16547 TaxID=3030993 RepID=UPI0024A17F6D|nr:transposase [Microtetraspora sp. NBRC 16547]GLX00942.1 hypothetical protein Misp02_50280 [Microtetraspora sp. NBRC 16547]